MPHFGQLQTPSPETRESSAVSIEMFISSSLLVSFAGRFLLKGVQACSTASDGSSWNLNLI